MTQLMLDTGNGGVELPEVIRKAYKAWKEDLGETITMISGRMVKELRGRVWRISYSRGWLSDAEKDAVIAACEKGRETPIACQFLVPNGNETLSSQFFVTDFSYPSFQWDTNGETPTPVWTGFSVELREVKPHD